MNKEKKTVELKEMEYTVSEDMIFSASEDEHDNDDRKVTHITMEFFYKPRTVIALIILILIVIIHAFIRL